MGETGEHDEIFQTFWYRLFPLTIIVLSPVLLTPETPLGPLRPKFRPRCNRCAGQSHQHRLDRLSTRKSLPPQPVSPFIRGRIDRYTVLTLLRCCAGWPRRYFVAAQPSFSLPGMWFPLPVLLSYPEINKHWLFHKHPRAVRRRRALCIQTIFRAHKVEGMPSGLLSGGIINC